MNLFLNLFLNIFFWNEGMIFDRIAYNLGITSHRSSLVNDVIEASIYNFTYRLNVLINRDFDLKLIMYLVFFNHPLMLLKRRLFLRILRSLVDRRKHLNFRVSENYIFWIKLFLWWAAFKLHSTLKFLLNSRLSLLKVSLWETILFVQDCLSMNRNLIESRLTRQWTYCNCSLRSSETTRARLANDILWSNINLIPFYLVFAKVWIQEL